MITIAGMAKVYEHAGEWGLAALKYGDVCAFAHQHAPRTVETAGDYSDLATMFENLGNHDSASEALERAVSHIKGAGEWDKYEPHFTAWRKRLEGGG